MGIYFLRHGFSQGNAGLPTPDHTLIELTEKGHAEAVAAAKDLPFVPEIIVCSPFLRTRQTAKPFLERFPEAKLLIMPELQEFTYLSPGTCSNTTSAQRRPRVLAYWRRQDTAYIDGPGAESFAGLVTRARTALQKLRSLKGKNILAVSHAQFIRAALRINSRPGLEPADYMRGFISLPQVGNCKLLELPPEGTASAYGCGWE